MSAMRVARTALLVATLALGSSGACRRASTPSVELRQPGTRSKAPLDVAELVYEGALVEPWIETSPLAGQRRPPGPARLAFDEGASWVLTRSGTLGPFGALFFRYRAPRELGDFLEVRADGDGAQTLPRIVVAAADRADEPDGWSEVLLPMERLVPGGQPFRRIVFRPLRPIGKLSIDFDHVGFTRSSAPVVTVGPPREVELIVNCPAPSHKISDLIFGTAYDFMSDPQKGFHRTLGTTGRRWGGNPASRYNWELGNAWNTANDWYFENVNYAGDPTFSYLRFLEENRAHKLATALTIPMLGWVAKDTSSYSFPVSEFGPQAKTDPERPDAGNGRSKAGAPLTAKPSQTSVAADAAFMRRWVAAIKAAEHGDRLVHMYILDNEPSLWNSTHEDVHPKPLTYDELLERTIQYGRAIREADPGALIAGPAEWGWPALFDSPADLATPNMPKRDRAAHGDMPLLPWYLSKLREYEKANGVRLLDVLDVHFYPQANDLYGGGAKTDPATAALRIRSTRALWDPSYVDESWIGDTVRLLPRLRDWIDKYYPGLRISIGEWNFGAEQHMSGGLATAEALGRFADENIYSAFYWAAPPEGSPAYWAFRAYRNYDGKGAHFEEQSVMASTSLPASIFAARNAKGTHITAVVLNFAPDVKLAARASLFRCGVVESMRVFVYDGKSPGFTAVTPEVSLGRPSTVLLPAYSISVIEFNLREH